MNLRGKRMEEAELSPRSSIVFVYGFIQGIEIGDVWMSRQELSDSRIHRPKAANIHAGGPNGVYSILISTRFRGEDKGLSFKYTGPKVKGSSFGIYNDALVKNYNTGTPIRVIRGARRNSHFAPDFGFRFDGLYTIEKFDKDKDGHIFFEFRRMQHDIPGPWIRAPGQYIPPPPPTVKDMSPFTSYIRYQAKPTKPSQIKSEPHQGRTPSESEEENSGRVTPSVESSESNVENSPPTTEISTQSEVHSMSNNGVPEENGEYPPPKTVTPKKSLISLPSTKVIPKKNVKLSSPKPKKNLFKKRGVNPSPTKSKRVKTSLKNLVNPSPKKIVGNVAAPAQSSKKNILNPSASPVTPEENIVNAPTTKSAKRNIVNLPPPEEEDIEQLPPSPRQASDETTTLAEPTNNNIPDEDSSHVNDPLRVVRQKGRGEPFILIEPLPSIFRNSSIIPPPPQFMVPLPKIYKEEIPTNEGFVVIETAHQEYEYYNESVVYEEDEEQAHSTDVGYNNVDNDLEEEEIDSEVINDVGNSQIVFAQSNVQLATMSDIDVEDGPKFTIGENSIEVSNVVMCKGPSSPQTENKEYVRQQTLSVIKQDSEEENVNEDEPTILNGNFPWLQETGHPIISLHDLQELSVPRESPPDRVSPEIVIPEIVIPEMVIPEIVSTESVSPENVFVPDTPLPDPPPCQIPPQDLQIIAQVGQKPDSTSSSDQRVQNISSHCHGKDRNCPFNDITFGELIAFAFNKPLTDCMCQSLHRLPFLRQFFHIMQQAKRDNNFPLPQKPARKQITGLPPEDKQITELPPEDAATQLEYDLGAGVASEEGRTINSTSKPQQWNNPVQPKQIDENPSVPEEIVNSDNDNLETSLPEATCSEVVPKITRIDQNHPKVKVVQSAELFWRGLEEVRDEALKYIYNMPQPIRDEAMRLISKMPQSNNDEAIKTNDAERSPKEANSPEPEEKVSQQCYYSETVKSERVLTRVKQKRKVSNVPADDSNRSESQEANPPASKVQMVERHNIRTEINRTRIVQLNNNNRVSTLSAMGKDIVLNAEPPPRENVLLDEPSSSSPSSRPVQNNINTVENRQKAQISKAIVHYEQIPTISEENVLDDKAVVQEVVDDKEEYEDLEYEADSSITERDSRSSSPSQILIVSTLTLAKNIPEKENDEDNSEIIEVPLSREKKTRSRGVVDMEDSSNDDYRNTADENNPNKLTPSSPSSSDTNSFDRKCTELCEDLPTIPPPATTAPVVSSVKELPKKRGRPRIHPIKSMKELPKKITHSTSLELSTKRPSKRLKSSQNVVKKFSDKQPKPRLVQLKGFSDKDVSRMLQTKEMFDRIVFDSQETTTQSPENTYTTESNNVPLRKKSSRPKKIAARYYHCFN